MNKKVIYLLSKLKPKNLLGAAARVLSPESQSFFDNKKYPKATLLFLINWILTVRVDGIVN